MNHLPTEIDKKPCAFVLQIHNPTETLNVLAKFFQDRKIPVDNLNLHRYRNGEASVIIHCQIEKDRISRTGQLLEQLPGVMQLEALR